MYSPRIRDDLIPEVYRAAKASGIPMTIWVNQVIGQALAEFIKSQKEIGQSKQNVAIRVCSQRIRKEKNSHDTGAI